MLYCYCVKCPDLFLEVKYFPFCFIPRFATELVQTAHLSETDIPQGLCEDINKTIKYRSYIHHVIHPGLLSQLEVLPCPAQYIQKIRAMKTNFLYLQVHLNFLGGL